MHPPSRLAYAHRPGWRPPRSLSDALSATYDWRLPTADRNGLPVWQAATVIVAIAAHPGRHRNWANAQSWLPETMHAIATTALEEAIAEKLAAWRQRTKIRDLYDLYWFSRHSTFNEQLTCRLLVLKIWHDTVDDRLGTAPFEPAKILAGSERWKLAHVDDNAFENQHVQHLMKVRMGDRQGIGVLEQSIFGPYRPYGLEGHIAPAG